MHVNLCPLRIDEKKQMLSNKYPEQDRAHLLDFLYIEELLHITDL